MSLPSGTELDPFSIYLYININTSHTKWSDLCLYLGFSHAQAGLAKAGENSGLDKAARCSGLRELRAVGKGDVHPVRWLWHAVLPNFVCIPTC